MIGQRDCEVPGIFDKRVSINTHQPSMSERIPFNKLYINEHVERPLRNYHVFA